MSEPTSHSKLDRAHFERLFRAHFVHLCNFARQYVQDLDTAKDLTQKVFIHLWENREKIDPRKAVQSYLFTAVRNRCLNHIRDHKKYRSRVLDVDIVDLEISFETEDSDLLEFKEKVAEALSALPEKCRLVFEMSRYQHMKYKEIAEELDISVKTVEAHMSKALKSLREQLRDYLPFLWIFFDIFH
jgi:RNA polymerase sigma-70 factor (ECF subfamily)